MPPEYSLWASLRHSWRRPINAACQIEEAIAREMKPGKTGRELFELSEAEGERLGYKDFLGGPIGSKCGFVGHGVGLELDEYPVLGSSGS